MNIPGFSFTLTNNVEARPVPSINAGQFEVSGTLHARFESPAFVGWYRREIGRHKNQLLRRFRPVMPKRQFQRLRGKARARARGLAL